MIVITDGIKELSKYRDNNDENLRGLKETVFELFNRLSRLVSQSDLDINEFPIAELPKMEAYWNNLAKMKQATIMKSKALINKRNQR